MNVLKFKLFSTFGACFFKLHVLYVGHEDDVDSPEGKRKEEEQKLSRNNEPQQTCLLY